MTDSQVPRHARVVPHSEHPEAYEAGNKLKVKFIEHFPLYSIKSSASRAPSDASTLTSTPLTTVSSAASMRSLGSIGSPMLTLNDENFQEEARRHEYNFEKEQGLYIKKQRDSRLMR